MRIRAAWAVMNMPSDSERLVIAGMRSVFFMRCSCRP